MNAQKRADAKAAKPVLFDMFETEKEVILNAKTTMHGLTLVEPVASEMLEHLESLGLIFAARDIGGYQRPPVLTLLGSQVFRYLHSN